MNYVGGRGPQGAKIAFIGEAPGEIEEKDGLPFVGPAGGLLWSICSEHGIKRDEVYVTNVLKYRPPNNQFHRASEIGVSIKDSVEKLKEEIVAIDPNIVVVFGNNALNALTGKSKITNWRGSILWWCGRKLIPTLHPAYVLHSSPDVGEREDGSEIKGEIFKYWMKYLISFDIERAIKHSHERNHHAPTRIIQYCTSAYDFHRFLEQQNDMSEMASDIEAAKGTCMPICNGIGFNANNALVIPLYAKVGEKFTGVREADLPQIWYTLAELYANPKIKKIGQNFKYDEDKINRLGFYLDKLSFDTMLMMHTVYPEFNKSLGFMTSILTEEPYYKDEGKLYDPAKDDFKVLMKYCGKDVCVTKEIKDELWTLLGQFGLQEFYTEFVNHLHALYLRMERIGFDIDTTAQESLVRKYADWSARNTARMYQILGYHLNVASPKQVAHTLYTHLKVPVRTGRGRSFQKSGGTGEEVLSGILASGVVKSDAVKELITVILTERRVRKTLGPQYLLARPDYDGKIKSTWNICGTENGRTSTRLLKPPVRPEKIGISFQTFTKHGDVGGDIRTYLTAQKGKVLVQVDSGQAEARVCMVLAEDWATLEKMDKIDIHAETASWIFGATWFDHSKKKHGHETPERFIGKTTRHAGHLDIRKGQFAKMITADARKAGIKIGLFSEYKAGKTLDAFHAHAPKVRSVFHDGVVKALEDNARILVSPHGRRRQFFDRWGRELWKEAYAFIPQATVSDNTKMAMLKMEDKYPGIPFVGESHDSMLFLADTDNWQTMALDAKKFMEAPIDFRRCTLNRDFVLTIPAEIEVGINYKDMEEWKG